MSRAVALFVVLVHCAPCGAQELGRLFFTPAERKALEARRGEKSGNAAPARVDGYVLRSGGRSTVWINGRMDRPKDGAEAEGSQGQAALSDRKGGGSAGVRR